MAYLVCFAVTKESSYPAENGRRGRTDFNTEVALEQTLVIVDGLIQQRNSHHPR